MDIVAPGPLLTYAYQKIEAAGVSSRAAKEEQQDALLLRPWGAHQGVLGIICDGHGAFGQESRFCAELFSANLETLWRQKRPDSPEDLLRQVVETTDRMFCQRMLENTQAVLTSWEDDPEATEAVELLGDAFFRNELGSGTTLTALMSWKGGFYVVHVGDSRLYLWLDGRLIQLSTDHRWSEGPDTETVDGVVYKHDLSMSRALGHPLLKQRGELSAEPEIFQVPFSTTPSWLLLCSDGLDVLSDQEIRELLPQPNIKTAALELLQAAEPIATDNLSLIALRLRVADPVHH